MKRNNSKKTPSIPSGFVHAQTVKNIEEYQYSKNGLNIVYVSVPGSGSVTVNIVYRVGSRHEERGKTGLAHLLEHMMFKPSRDRFGKQVRPPRHITLQNQGALLNASTWNDRTNYYFTMPKEYFGDILLAESERMRGLILTDKEFMPERQNVLSEYEMVTERPEVALDAAVVGAAFVSHGYGHDTIGFKPDISSCTVGDLQSFYDTYYWPNNATLVVVGDVSRDEVFVGVRKYFSHIPASRNPIPTGSIQEPAQEGERRVEITRPNPLSIVTVSFRGPKGMDASWIHGHILLSYLTEGKLSILYKRLVDTHKASSVTSSLPPTHDEYVFGISATAVQGVSLDFLEKEITSALESMRTQKISTKDIRRIQQKMVADMLYRRDGTHMIAQELTEYIAMGDIGLYHAVLDRVEATTPEDVCAFAKTYIVATQKTVGRFIGHDDVHPKSQAL